MAGEPIEGVPMDTEEMGRLIISVLPTGGAAAVCLLGAVTGRWWAGLAAYLALVLWFALRQDGITTILLVSRFPLFLVPAIFLWGGHDPATGQLTPRASLIALMAGIALVAVTWLFVSGSLPPLPKR